MKRRIYQVVGIFLVLCAVVSGSVIVGVVVSRQVELAERAEAQRTRWQMLFGSKAADASSPEVPVLARPQTTLTNDLDTVVSVAATPTCTLVAAANANRRALSIQNLSTVVVCCGKSSSCTCGTPPAASTAVLKSGTAVNDGTGGSIGITQYGGVFYCSSSSGAANVIVGSF